MKVEHAVTVAPASTDTPEPNDAEPADPGPWEKGGPSPNPSGRDTETARAMAEVRKEAQKWTKEAIGTLTGIMVDKRVSVETRRKAANDLLDRAVGKPTQPVSGPDGGDLRLDVGEQVVSKLDSLIDSIAGGSDEGQPEP